MGASLYSTHFRPGDVDMWLTVFSGETGRMIGVLCGKALSLWKTGATAAVATRYLAREDASVAAIVGTGRYALAQLRCLATVRDLQEVRCFSRDATRREAFVREARAALPGLRIVACDSARGGGARRRHRHDDHDIRDAGRPGRSGLRQDRIAMPWASTRRRRARSTRRQSARRMSSWTRASRRSRRKARS